MNKYRLCLVEDDAIMSESLCDRFILEGFECDCHGTAASAMKKIGRENYAAIISDIRLPDMSGEEMFARLGEQRDNLPPFVFITGYASIERAVELLKLGAADYISKPFDLDALIEKLQCLVCTVLPCSLRHEAPKEPFLGISPSMRKIEELVGRISRSSSTILISGESGVGKERIAQMIHSVSPDTQTGPFVAVNCGAFVEGLLEAELFGYEKGAFTGALRTKKGVFEQAIGGTLFLDEIGDMPPAMQVKVLRVIQERQIMRVGGETSIRANVRLIFATHRELKRMVESGSFREDLFYRINVINIKVPPLRERKEDILWLARSFLAEFSAKLDLGPMTIHPSTEQALLRYEWPGNIRELRHRIERACVLSEKKELRARMILDDVPPDGGEDADYSTMLLATYLDLCEKHFILQALCEHQWRIKETSAAIGVCRKTLWEKMRKLGIQGQVSEAESAD